MKILALGDVVGTRTVGYLEEKLGAFQRAHKIDFTVANGENATEIRGLCAQDAKRLLLSGIDVITLGNHAFGMKDLIPMLESDPRLIRPANYPSAVPGMGYTVGNYAGWRILTVNINGRVFMEAFGDPFDTVDRILAREAGHYDCAVMDIHAEATSEKMALGRYFDGRVAVIFGTHTHVTTADEQILPGGSGYQTDLGMCGPTGGIIGTETDAVIRKFRTMLPTGFSPADGEIRAHGTVFDFDGNKVTKVERVVF